MSWFIWKAFVNSTTVRRVTLGIVIVLLAGSIFSVWKTYSLPTEREETVDRVRYVHNGEFGYQVYASSGIVHGLPSKGEEAPLIYFREIIDSIDVSFNYEFVPYGVVTGVKETVTISALLEDPGMWQKEVILLLDSKEAVSFTVDFPLELETLEALVDTIEDEIGTDSRSVDVTIIASVHTVAQTGSGKVDDDFVQTMKITVDPTTLKWEPELSRYQTGFSGGLSYKQQGWFDYTINLRENSLYETATLAPPEPSPAGSPVVLPVGEVYFPRIVDYIDGSFSYSFECSALNQVSSTVEVMAVLEYPELWRREFVLINEMVEGGNFTGIFPLDIDQYIELTNVIRNEIGRGIEFHDLTITAEVHTTAETDYGTVDEVFSQSLTGQLSTIALIWGSELDKLQSSSITETVTIPIDNSREVWLSRGALILVVLFSLYVAWNYTKVRAALPVFVAESEVWRVRKKRRISL